MRRLVFAQLWQVQQQNIRRAEHGRRKQGCRSRLAGRQIIDRAILAHGIDAAQVGVGDGYQPQFRHAAIVVEQDHIAGIQRQP